ncbi:hypothetical protein BJX99DRAFT_234306 [Aspergillus californicus]
MWDIPLSTFLDPDNNRLLSASFSYPWTVGFAKISILLLYRRLFPFSRELIAI